MCKAPILELVNQKRLKMIFKWEDMKVYEKREAKSFLAMRKQ